MHERRMVIEVIDDDMADVLRRKTGAQRLQIADAMFLSARALIVCLVKQTHPEVDQ